VSGKFEVYTDSAGKFRFRLKAGNGEVIAVGEAYESKAGVDTSRVAPETAARVAAGRPVRISTAFQKWA
jgi:uncharacterized protein YegP (UPF0339 family)